MRACSTARAWRDYLVLLDAQRTQLDAEDSVAQARTAVNVAAVAIYRALGGIGQPDAGGRAQVAMTLPGTAANTASPAAATAPSEPGSPSFNGVRQ